MRHFNSQPHEEADGVYLLSVPPTSIISTHSLTKRLTELLKGWKMARKYFNSQPHEEADCDEMGCSRQLGYFNSQPHEEADETSSSARDNTLNFNSQPHEEADIPSKFSRKMLVYFNSQPHEEADSYPICILLFHMAFQLTASRRG